MKILKFGTHIFGTFKEEGNGYFQKRSHPIYIYIHISTYNSIFTYKITLHLLQSKFSKISGTDQVNLSSDHSHYPTTKKNFHLPIATPGNYNRKFTST